MNDAQIEEQITNELMDQAFAGRDAANRCRMDAVAARRYRRPDPAYTSCTPALIRAILMPPGSSSPTWARMPSSTPRQADTFIHVPCAIKSAEAIQLNVSQNIRKRTEAADLIRTCSRPGQSAQREEDRSS